MIFYSKEKYLKIKRALDFIMALFLLFILMPFMIFISIIIKLDSNGPVIFKQMRIGKDKKKFYIYKFRTMKINAPKNLATHLLDNPNIYITRIGNFLRKTSLDELPQLFNILKGDMSFIGPRPALFNQYDLINLRENFGVNKILPGLTGWAQINGRDEISIKQKVFFDHEYLKKISLMLDIKIFLLTIKKVLLSENIKLK